MDIYIYISKSSCDGKMENGSLRCDLNVSIAPYTTTSSTLTNTIKDDPENPFLSYLPPGTGNRVEVKNLNSMKQGTFISTIQYTYWNHSINKKLKLYCLYGFYCFYRLFF